MAVRYFNMKEIWKQIKGYPDYFVSNTGKVKSYRYPSKGRIIMGHLDKDGYRRILLYSAPGVRKTKGVHRLVAEAFIPNPNNYPVINHKDENRSNNNANNLEWCTVKYNNNYGNRNKKVRKALYESGSKFYGLPVTAYKNGVYKHFKSYGDASRNLGVDIADVCLLVTKGFDNYKNLKTIKGWQFVKQGEEYKIDPNLKGKGHNTNSFYAIKGDKKILFKTRAEASRQLNMDSSYISKCLKKGHKGCGWTFKYVD